MRNKCKQETVQNKDRDTFAVAADEKVTQCDRYSQWKQKYKSRNKYRCRYSQGHRYRYNYRQTYRRNLVTKYWYEMRMQLRVLQEFLASMKIT